MTISLIIGFLLLVVFAELGAGDQDECKEAMCRPQGPLIRYPFRLKGHQPDHCGLPGFDLFCSQRNHTMLELPSSVKVLVTDIDYTNMWMLVRDPGGCLPRQLRNLNLSASFFQPLPQLDQEPYYYYRQDPYYYYRQDPYYYYRHKCSRYRFAHTQPTESHRFALFNCSSREENDYGGYYEVVPLICTSEFIYAVDSEERLDDIAWWLSNCTKMYDSSVPCEILVHPLDGIMLSWSEPICRNCSEQGLECRLNNDHRAQCVDFSTDEWYPSTEQSSRGASNSKIVAGVVTSLCLFLVLLVTASLFQVISSKRRKLDQIKIEKFLEGYRALKPARYSYADIKKITNQFKDKLGQGGYGIVYKGKLSNDVFVAVKVLNSSKGNGEEFINEVSTIGRIHHVNVVRLVGYCADGIRRALVYELLPNDSLERFISSEHRNCSLGWDALLHIAVGIAKGIDYLHQGCDQRILHFDIKPRNILLDHNFNPKISDFGQAKLCSKEQSAVSMTAARGTMGYIAPEVFSRNFGNVSYKSDVYSFGMLLLEMVGGSRSPDAGPEENPPSQFYFPEWAYNRLDQGEGLGIQVENEEDVKTAEKLTIVGLWCIQWYPVDRPSMKVVIQMLQGEEGSLDMPSNPFGSTNPSRNTSAIMPGRMFESKLEVITESE